MYIHLTILGDPKPQKRHRSARVGGFIRQYDPSKADKGDFLSIIQQQAPKTPLDVPLRMELGLFFSRPKSHYGTGSKSTVLKANAPIWHTSKPDFDNVAKFICDAMNGVFFKDDSYVVDIIIKKQYKFIPFILNSFHSFL